MIKLILFVKLGFMDSIINVLGDTLCLGRKCLVFTPFYS